MHADLAASGGRGGDDAAQEPAGLPARRREVVLVGAAWLVGQLVFFRSEWLSGFDRVMGDSGAARFIVYVNENWYQALLGHASWRNPGFYFPVRNTLGLSDTLLLWQVVYAPARALGADPFLAYQVVLVALSAIGFASFYLLTRTLWHPGVGLGIVGATLFAFSNALYTNANHPQLFGVLLLPAVGLLGVGAWRAASGARRVGAVWGFGLGALGVLVVYSTYYVGFFAVLGVAIAVALTLATSPRRAVRRLTAVLVSGWATALGVVAGASGPLVLFLVTYLPALHATGGYGVLAARFFAPRAADLVNVGTGNLVWGSLLVAPAVHGTAALGERDYAVTPILLVAAVVATVAATVLERRRHEPLARRYVPAVLCATGLALLVAPLEVGSTFLWRAVAWLPGAAGIRAVDRIAVVAGLALVLALVAACASLWPSLAAAAPRTALVAVACVLGAALCLEQVNVADSSQLSRSAQVAALDAVPAPPAGCASFFVETATGSVAHPARTQTTAMLLSERFGLPTLNGTSGSFPTGWHLLYPTRPGYLADAARWIVAHRLAGVCALDLDADSWSIVTSPTRAPAP